MRLPVSIKRRGDNRQRAGFFGVARGSENLSRNFHGARIDTAAHGAAAAGHRVVERASGARDRVEQDEDVLACFDQSFRALDRQLRNARVTLDIAVVRAGHQLRRRMRSAKIGHFLRAFIDQKNDQDHLRMILCDRIGDVMQQRRFACARWRDNQTALAHAQRRHQVHDPRRVTIRHGLELDLFVRIDGGQFFKWTETLIFRPALRR